ncbi:acetyl-CoA carboxylase biotin carboxyl carrier protein subunit [Sphingomonas fennica]|uniref:Acetyl-CoA carboxylase biotin carboxyl carrier protein subunit n=1 Tax=Edaphosphingomonas fennica TaxID=114404 RepID=A0A2T4I4P4_9SPHN|nr:acetyl-CoA carboxylase biotin carboxyl carrier protein subunit [Sphingomonas fennica]PTD24492.1 acetyl-CoA carboxylase biotin carboxyl carrier protein subunit [Sphingomonas fennica]
MPGFFLIDGVAHPAALAPADLKASPPEEAIVAKDGDHIWVHVDGAAHELVWQDPITHFEEESASGGDDVARAPMPGSVIQVAVTDGDSVTEGEIMMVIESMKLETAIKAPRDGVVMTVHRAIGQTFERDAALITLEAIAL